MQEVRVGCSGFSYAQWKGNFYPEDFPPRKWLQYYAMVFRAVELNVTFYRLRLRRLLTVGIRKHPLILFSAEGKQVHFPWEEAAGA